MSPRVVVALVVLLFLGNAHGQMYLTGTVWTDCNSDGLFNGVDSGACAQLTLTTLSTYQPSTVSITSDCALRGLYNSTLNDGAQYQLCLLSNNVFTVTFSSLPATANPDGSYCVNFTALTQVVDVDWGIYYNQNATIPAGVTVSCTASRVPPATGVATVSDYCGNIGVTYSDFIGPGVNSGCGTITRTWRSTFTNNVLGTQLITVADNTPPALSVPNGVLASCTATSPSSTGFATATDDCSTPTITYSDTVNLLPGTDGCISSIERTWRATDSCGSVSSGSQYISVTDNAPPEFVNFPTDASTTCDVNSNTVYSQWLSTQGGATAIDNCYNPVNWQNNGPAQVSCGTSTLVTFTASDPCGNFLSNSAAFIVGTEPSTTSTPVPPSASNTPTGTGTPTATTTSSRTLSNTRTPTSSGTPTPTETSSPGSSPSSTPAETPSGSQTKTASVTKSPSASSTTSFSNTGSATVGSSVSSSRSASGTPSGTRTGTPSTSSTVSGSTTTTRTASGTPSASGSVTRGASASNTPSTSRSNTVSATPSGTPSVSSTRSASAIPSSHAPK